MNHADLTANREYILQGRSVHTNTVGRSTVTYAALNEGTGFVRRHRISRAAFLSHAKLPD